MSPEELKQKLVDLSNANGFLAVGVAKSARLSDEEDKFNQWLNNGYAGEMDYLKRNTDKRLDPALLVDGAKSIITFLHNYYPAIQPSGSSYKVARYARGTDYHKVMKDKIHLVANGLKQLYGNFNYRVFTDSAPVMERQWAARAGLGWLGKNSLLLRQGAGSYFFIGTLICDLDLPADQPTTDHCGTCTACIDACPTDAIVANQVIDARRCISYHTIELKGSIPPEFRGKTEDWIFGCDICQEVCPWNRFSTPHTEPAFDPTGEWHQWNKREWENLSERDFEIFFAKTAITRAGYNKLKSNIAFQG